MVILFQIALVKYWLPLPSALRILILMEAVRREPLWQFINEAYFMIDNLVMYRNPFLINVGNDTDDLYYMITHMFALLNIIPSITRIGITIMFMCAFGLQTVRNPIMQIWLRVIDSENPVFTLLGVGIGGGDSCRGAYDR
jgi:hypothetical protein